MGKCKTIRSKSKEWRIWSMFKDKGQLCILWYESFDKFITDMKLPPDNCYGMRRPDTSKAFSKDNCEWRIIDKLVRKSSKEARTPYVSYIEPLGELLTELKIENTERIRVRQRINYNMMPQEALHTPFKGVVLIDDDTDNKMMLKYTRASVETELQDNPEPEPIPDNSHLKPRPVRECRKVWHPRSLGYNTYKEWNKTKKDYVINACKLTGGTIARVGLRFLSNQACLE